MKSAAIFLKFEAGLLPYDPPQSSKEYFKTISLSMYLLHCLLNNSMLVIDFGFCLCYINFVEALIRGRVWSLCLITG